MAAGLFDARRCLQIFLGGLLTSLALLALIATTASAKSLGQWTAGDVDAGIAAGVAYLDASADKTDTANIHWDGASSSGDTTDTGFAIAAIGSALKESPASVSASQLADAKNAVQWLIKQQDTTGGADTLGSWGFSSGSNNSNYATSIALMALSFFDTEPGAANAISMGRAYEIAWQTADPSTTGNASSACTASSVGDYGNCGAWTYSPGGCPDCGGDTSNTGFGVTGLEFSGGVPGPTAAANLGWARAIQELNTNPYATQNDGGGTYYPGFSGSSCCRSSANDTGTDLFMFAYDGVPDTDAGVQAALKLGQDALDTEENDAHTTAPRQGVVHNPPAQTGTPPPGSQEDGSCTVGASGCDWGHDSDGGYHYSLFALSKGMGSYVAPNLADPTNFYAKVVDLLLSQQDTDGSWAADLRDDGSPVGAASFSILALSKAGQRKAVPEAPAPAVSAPATPAAQACTDTRRFTFTLHHARGQRVVKAKTFVNGRLVKTVKGHALRRLTIDRLPQQTFVVKIVSYQSSGSRLSSTRVYSGCTKSRPKIRAHHHRRHHHR